MIPPSSLYVTYAQRASIFFSLLVPLDLVVVWPFFAKVISKLNTKKKTISVLSPSNIWNFYFSQVHPPLISLLYIVHRYRRQITLLYPNSLRNSLHFWNIWSLPQIFVCADFNLHVDDPSEYAALKFLDLL